MSHGIPHDALQSHYQSLEEKQSFLRRVFDRAAPYYEGIAGWGFFGTGPWYRLRTLRTHGLKEGMKVVDVAAGTGPTARAAAEIVGDPKLVTAVEPSEGMLNESKKQLDCTHIQACAEDMPLPDNEFDFLTMGFALRHVDNLANAFKEYHRVLKPGGKACVMDITKPKNPVAYFFLRLYFRDIFPFMTRVLTGSKDAAYLMEYYWETLDQMTDPEEVLECLRTAGFKDAEHHLVLGIFSEYTAVKP